jgi:hypothetical protein
MAATSLNHQKNGPSSHQVTSSPNDALLVQSLGLPPLPNHHPSQGSSSSLKAAADQQPLSVAALFSMNLPSMPQQQQRLPSNNASSLSLLGTGANCIMEQLLEQASTSLIQQVINQEKQRLVETILRNQAAAAVAVPAHTHTSPLPLQPQQQQHQPQAPRNARRIAETIGSQVRSGQPYVDMASIPGVESASTSVVPPRNRGGHKESFPAKLSRMLNEVQDSGDASIVSWLPHGRAFIVHDTDKFIDKILPKYFKQSKRGSFARQLNLYGFLRVPNAPDCGAYYHELFLKGRPSLCLYMRRVGVPQENCDRRKVKNRLLKAAPDFYSMKACV